MQGNWTAQVEEVVALQAILEEDFSLLGGQGLHDGIDLTADSLIELEPPSAPIRLECQALARVSLLRDSLDLRGSQQQWQQQEPQQAQQQPAELVIMQLLRYNAARDHQLFREGTWACGICLEELPGVRCLRVGDCKHAFCQDCLGQQCRLNVREGTIENLRCPEPQCKAPMNRQVVKSLLSPEEAARWEDLELQRTLAHMQDVVYCPRCSSACLEDGQNCAQCARCFFAYCSLCNEAWHPGRQCVSAATKLELLRNRMKGVRHESGSELRRKELEMMSLKSIEETTKPCPRCSMAIQKSQGCNKMTCANCNTFFCYRCGREIEGYSHYKDSGCVLFEEAEILRWQDEWEAQQHGAVGHVNQLAWAQHARANDAPPGMRVCPCPQCGQANMKVGNNNHMACWACTCHFCYSCRKLLRGKGIGAAHYGPKGCKQHSAD
ncbi:hypothetical protein WJX72_002540 [[Myrmecia] bisecta]|uniref:RBR-type E3 ubiquitin transferase n=1 Tax=[Myrmecia] bisecta TaxID=41462 RepID=A0AAW1PWR3_9CHLO